ncbi:hypothetical protein Aab01nite_26600 [Paractinoplanes abujensis]|uniref:Bulb-type lectin domain-containing protein n=1 Tax=Paractinoplanes abujensis TaxID=882441 RepID=A0A7W7D169_9ACTN|nr:hypothetical protein [Actinoplanes abujensis]MBB4698444.1 hypothetical protein [Actinoplanes abujensis]GID19070.1 hypothetical protein Aab01nite_26600 [Actinoplanes abujensis]
MLIVSLLTVAAPARAAAGQSLLTGGERLNPGQSLISPNGQFRLTMQGDGALKEVRAGVEPVWQAVNLRMAAGSTLEMQGDGNLVVYGPGHVALWSTGTAGRNGSVLRLQDDGNLVVYAPGNVAVWATNACATVNGSLLCGPILAKYREQSALLGLPISGDFAAGGGRGRGMHFQHGSVYYSPATGAHSVRGWIRSRWAMRDWENGPVGFPTSDEYAYNGGQRSTFESGCSITVDPHQRIKTACTGKTLNDGNQLPPPRDCTVTNGGFGTDGLFYRYGTPLPRTLDLPGLRERWIYFTIYQITVPTGDTPIGWALKYCGTV